MGDNLHILCFGDSLTAGYHDNGLRYSPYSKAFLAKLKDQWPERPILVETDGVAGDLVVSPPGQFRRRMERRFQPHHPKSYSWVIILGGTNDLGWGKSPTQIHSALTAISATPLSHGAKVLFMTVPECSVVKHELDESRNALNDLIRHDGRKEVHFFDLRWKLPYHNLSARERARLWGEDGLHFTKKGYEFIGEAVAERLIEILVEENAKQGSIDANEEQKAIVPNP